MYSTRVGKSKDNLVFIFTLQRSLHFCSKCVYMIKTRRKRLLSLLFLTLLYPLSCALLTCVCFFTLYIHTAVRRASRSAWFPWGCPFVWV